ncbi:MAG: DUF1786 domain-containing protein [Candidatus Hydrogenedentota bacterium]|nr:MAG: DUF1786 domain-containing protein [Candidatus Hydrogenedentota bacterium]
MQEDGSLLAIDVGGGTQDMLVYVRGQPIENCPKMVMPSPTRVVAKKIARATLDRKPIFLFGEIMGGGRCARAARAHIAAGLPLFATPGAALTFHDNLKRVEQMGIVLADSAPADAVRIRMGDVDMEAITLSLGSFGVEVPQRWAVAVQDHGHSPDGSNREARFRWYRDFIESGGRLDRLAFQDVPELFTRMLAIKNVLPGALVMDTGSAAILGALLDETVRKRQAEGLVVVNVGNYHVMGAMVRGERMLGLFEHHTGLMDPDGLKAVLERFRVGELSNDDVLRDGGHGCHIERAFVGKSPFHFLALTGPNREMLRDEKAYLAMPHGDMMLTGCFGLVSAARKAGIIRD